MTDSMNTTVKIHPEICWQSFKEGIVDQCALWYLLRACDIQGYGRFPHADAVRLLKEHGISESVAAHQLAKDTVFWSKGINDWIMLSGISKVAVALKALLREAPYIIPTDRLVKVRSRRAILYGAAISGKNLGRETTAKELKLSPTTQHNYERYLGSDLDIQKRFTICYGDQGETHVLDQLPSMRTLKEPRAPFTTILEKARQAVEKTAMVTPSSNPGHAGGDARDSEGPSRRYFNNAYEYNHRKDRRERICFIRTKHSRGAWLYLVEPEDLWV